LSHGSLELAVQTRVRAASELLGVQADRKGQKREAHQAEYSHHDF
jgi:hypothetical protein